jgi:hypothetical protein
MAGKLIGLKAIDNAITQISGIVANVDERVQEVAVAIVEHAAGPGQGDVSRALPLVQALSNAGQRTLLVRWFLYHGSIGINLRGNDGRGAVKRVTRDSKTFRKDVPNGYDVDGARLNNWFQPFNEKGERAIWYQGPNPDEFVPNTLVDFSNGIENFVTRMTKQLDATKEVRIDGELREVDLYALSPEQRDTAKKVLGAMSRVAALATSTANRDALEAELTRMDGLVKELEPEVERMASAG